MYQCGIDAPKSALPPGLNLLSKCPCSSQNSKNRSEFFLELPKIWNPARHLESRIFAARNRRKSPQTLALRRSLIFRLVLIKSLEFGFAHSTRNAVGREFPGARVQISSSPPMGRQQHFGCFASFSYICQDIISRGFLMVKTLFTCTLHSAGANY